MTTMTSTGPAKLPLWRTVGQAYAVWAKNLPDLFRICWLWIVVMIPILGIWTWLQAPHILQILQAAKSGGPFTDPNPFLTLVSQLIGQVIVLPAVASVAVAWHRLLLRDERPGAGLYLRFDRVVVGYAILAFWIGVITLTPRYIGLAFEIVTGTSVDQSNPAAMAVQFFAAIAMIASFFIVARLSLALPAAALQREDVTLATAWRVSRRNTWRMLWAYFFCLLPWLAIGGALSYWMFAAVDSRAALTLISLFAVLPWIPVGMISVGMLSLAYRHFFESGA